MSVYRKLTIALFCLLLLFALPAAYAEAPGDAPGDAPAQTREAPPEAPSGEKPGDAPEEKEDMPGEPGEMPGESEAPGEQPEAPAEGEAAAPVGNPTPLKDIAELQQGSDGCLIVPVPSGEGWQSAQVEGCSYYLEKHEGSYMYQYKVLKPLNLNEAFAEENIRHYFEQISYGVSQLGGASEIRQINGYDVFLYNVPNAVETRGNGRLGCVLYIRGDKQFTVNYCVYPETVFENCGVPPMENLEDLAVIAAGLNYDESKSEIGLSITAEGSPAYMTAGRKQTFTAVFNDPEVISARNGNMDVTWSVTDRAGNPVEGITINRSGTLSASKKLKENTEVVVHAESVSYLTTAEYALTVVPAVQKITIEPSSLTLFLGVSQPATVKAVIEPEGIPGEVLIWKAFGGKIVEVADQGDGTAVVTPVAVGKASVAASEAGGEKDSIKVYVARAVTDLELSWKGKGQPGTNGTVKVSVLPKEATYKDVSFSLDVAENVATINKNGTLKISKEAAPGTVITVSCTAEGAPEPIVKTLTVTVAEEEKE